MTADSQILIYEFAVIIFMNELLFTMIMVNLSYHIKIIRFKQKYKKT